MKTYGASKSVNVFRFSFSLPKKDIPLKIKRNGEPMQRKNLHKKIQAFSQFYFQKHSKLIHSKFKCIFDSATFCLKNVKVCNNLVKDKV